METQGIRVTGSFSSLVSLGSLGLWVSGSLGLWVFGSLGLRVFGSLGSLGLWVSGSLGLWGFWVSGSLGSLGLWVSGPRDPEARPRDPKRPKDPEPHRPQRHQRTKRASDPYTLSFQSISEVMISDVTGAFYTAHKPLFELPLRLYACTCEICSNKDFRPTGNRLFMDLS